MFQTDTLRLNTLASAIGNFMNSPALFASTSQNSCLALKALLPSPNCKAVDVHIPVANLQSAVACLALRRNFCSVFISDAPTIRDHVFGSASQALDGTSGSEG